MSTRTEYNKAYYAANREKRLAQQKAYYAASREKRLAYARSYREANRDALNEKRRDYGPIRADKVRERDYGVTPERFKELAEAQDWKCAICEKPQPGGSKRDTFHIDHDHSCCPGKTSCGQCVRGLLCDTCNFGLGMFRDDKRALKRAIQYLEEYK